MANFMDKINSAISAFKSDVPEAAELSSSQERLLKEMCYIGDLEALKAQQARFILPVGVVISKHAKIGKNCVIYQNVTIGGKDFGQTNPANYPTIGENVIIYPGAFIVGPVTIGSNTVIGANTVVVSNVPENSMVGGNPAKIMPR